MEEEAFASMVEETKGIVLTAIKKNLFSEYYYAMDDVVQETYIRAYRSLIKSKFREESKLSSWLYTIARNEAIRMNRKLKRGEKRRKKYAEQRQESMKGSREKGIVDEVENEDIIEDLRKAVRELPGKYECVINLYLKGFTERQIAGFLSIPRGTVKSRIHRGKERLKGIFNEEDI